MLPSQALCLSAVLTTIDNLRPSVFSSLFDQTVSISVTLISWHDGKLNVYIHSTTNAHTYGFIFPKIEPLRQPLSHKRDREGHKVAHRLDRCGGSQSSNVYSDKSSNKM